MTAFSPIRAKGRLMLSAALAVLAAAPHAQAQQTTPAQQSGGGFALLGRIVLGAGSPKVAIDTPQAVSTVEQEDLDRDRPQTLSDLFKTVPGVSGAGASARPAGQAFNIRGIGNTEQTASEARIIVTVDGAPKFFEQYRMGSFFGDFELFKRVEVLRGPASSTLYGSGALGGVVAFTTKDASDFLTDGQDRVLRFKADYASNGDAYGAGVIWAQRYSDQFETLAALNYGTRGEVDDGAGVAIAGTGFDRWSGLLKGKYSFGANADQSLTLSMSRTDGDLPNSVVAQSGGAIFIPSFGNADIRTIDDTATLQYRHEFAGNPWLDLTATLSYTDTAVTKRNFTFGMMCAPGQMQVLCDGDFSYRTTSLKIENTSDLSMGAWDNSVIVGLQVQNQQRIATSSAGPMEFHPEGRDRKIGLYAQGEFVYDDRLTIIPGLRVDFGRLRPSDAVIAQGGVASDETAVSPKLALHYKINDDWAVFGSIARTERMPTLDELYSSGAPTATLVGRTPSLNLLPEKANSVELGFAWQRDNLFSDGDSLQVKVTGFHNDVQDLIATTPRPTVGSGAGPVPYYSNINRARLWGAELEASYDAERWFAQAAWSKVKTKDKTTGIVLTDTPAETVALTLGAKIPAHDLSMGWRMNWADAIKTGSATTSASSWHTHDVFVTWKPSTGRFGGTEVQFGVDNLFDRDYRQNLALDKAPGRTVKLALARSF
ncbi:TonB-dependent receptor [Tabrizicola sp. DMG-N-6]|uniref:TonB-dependent receptor n=2 Tax=Szabonella alba TaxID=2804194 RepID=A0A8K0V7I7_9RHOB|nr:TonB-dependent receptor [Szabonella alba]